MIVWLAVALWVMIVAWSLALMRAASGVERAEPEPLEQPPPRPTPAPGPHRELNAVIAQTALLVGAVALAALLSTEEQWARTDLVGLLAVVVVGSDFLTLRAKRFRISGSFLGLVLAMALLGPAPAVAMGLACASVDALRGRIRGPYLLNNLATYAVFPLLGALVLMGLEDLGLDQDGGYALAVFAVFVGANVLNFVLIAGHTVYLRGGSLVELFRTVYLPVLPWELATASLTAMTMYAFEVYGNSVIGLFALALGVCQLLLRSLLEGQAHGEEVVRRTDQLDIRHEGMVGLLLETLALRDPTAARHAAAVAHYAHQLAKAAGLGQREQAIAHTAGLLHDIGKEALPDHILLGRSELHAAERRLVERHPTDGARLLLRVEGLGEVANAVLAHHERIDGHGYPDGLAGDEIPMTARILSIAEVYDVLTAPDSYKIPLGAAEAEDELRRVAGSQLDGRLVWLFVTQVLRGTVIDHDGRIADLEAELQIQRRMRGVLDQPLVLGPPTG
ncbi:MAG TPA: HD domain-containing phosphohydrolase [Solirubrobacteraceae bacterium]|nr:HD domain-containing phosphohydrolase [Solirubrobacteraceae bacterium]